MAKIDKKIEPKKRPPVVVVLGHIDHGKTSLLMAIKDFRVLSKESGGITQHVGAYQVEFNNEKITFIDTPGHESFSAIRSRGAKLADIGILVIDAAEGIKKQTREAIKNIKETGITPIIALNKIDKPEANPEKIKQDLLQEDIWVESMGGKVPCVEVSAKTKQGIDELLEMILLVSEVENLEAFYEGETEAVVVESRIDPQKGASATVIVIQGTIEQGDFIGTDSSFGKIRTLENFQKKNISAAYPSDPAIVFGFENVPSVGEKVKLYGSLEEARKSLKPKNVCIKNPSIAPGDKVLNILIKADVIGSLEGILEVLKSIPQERVKINILREDIGNVNEKDVKLVKSCGGTILAFRVKADSVAENIIQNSQLPFFDFDIIYELASQVRILMEALLITEKERIDLGEMEVLAIFRTEKERQIVGGRVLDGRIEQGVRLEVLRDNEILGDGKVMGIEIAKKKVSEASKNTECGILFQGKVKIQEGDILRFYKEEFIKPGLDV